MSKGLKRSAPASLGPPRRRPGRQKSSNLLGHGVPRAGQIGHGLTLRLYAGEIGTQPFKPIQDEADDGVFVTFVVPIDHDREATSAVLRELQS